MYFSSRAKIIFYSIAALLLSPSVGFAEERAAKYLFGAHKLPTITPASSHGFYTKGCLAGGVAMPIDGPTWQVMRLERNRRWGHPELIALVQDLSQKAAFSDGWPGLLIGDISQPRGGPMFSGHLSHQVGLDADIWLTPMPSRKLTYPERANMSAVSVLKKGTLEIDPTIWTKAHANLIMRAAGYKNVERLFVHPGIKKELCDNWKGNRRHLGKVRPYYGHHYHFHIRLTCPKGSPDCKSQAAIPEGTGCDASLAWWFEPERWAPPKPEKSATKLKKPLLKTPLLKTMADLPTSCGDILTAPQPDKEADVTLGKMVTSPIQLNYTARPDFRTMKNIPLPLNNPSDDKKH